MRAVNLIPPADRKGAAGAPGRSGGVVYILLGALALVVLMASVYALTDKSGKNKQATLARVSAEAAATESRAGSLAPYTQFAALRDKRVQTVTELSASRFDWAHALHELSRTLPRNAWLTQVVATARPGVPVGDSTPAGNLRSALPVPAVELAGCTTSQASVAKMLARMRLIDGVQRVSLAESSKVDSAGGSASNSDCRGSSRHFPMFSMVVFFRPMRTVVAAQAPATQTASTTTAASPQPASGGSTP